MGLGKTVQSIAFLCHIAETYRKLLFKYILERINRIYAPVYTKIARFYYLQCLIKAESVEIFFISN